MLTYTRARGGAGPFQRGGAGMHGQQAVVARNVCAMRAAPDGSAEQVSQAIFGEMVRILDTEGPYARIQTPDAYEGWMLERCLCTPGSGGIYPEPSRAAAVACLFAPVFREPSDAAERVTLLTLGSLVEVTEREAAPGYSAVKLPDGTAAYLAASALMEPPVPPKDLEGSLVQAALGLIGVPYLWGGRTPFGMDCSGFVQRVYWLCGHTIPRDAHEQAAFAGFEEADASDARAGDLIFFGRGHTMDRSGITHVGMCLGDGRFIHSAGSFGVIVTSMDDPEYRAIYRCSRRLRGSAS